MEFQLGVTRALIKFIEDHHGHVDKDLRLCLKAMEGGNSEVAATHARMVKPHGMGGITDWFPKPISEKETSDYNEALLRALTNEWCRAISLLSEDRDRVSRSAQKGELPASIWPDGYVLCPFCGKSFSSKSDSWDGARHKTCGVRLRLVPTESGQS